MTGYVRSISNCADVFGISNSNVDTTFIKFDFSELPALLAAYAMGPVSGIAVCFIKNVINLLHTQTGGVGELSNFILGVCFVLPAGLIYKRRKHRRVQMDRSIRQEQS